MKPIVIIAVSVVCSVIAVLGVLVILEMYAANESQKAVAIELERQNVCNQLYDNSGTLRELELWGVCINYGIVEVVNDEVSDCGTGSHYSAQMCRMDTKILAMKVVNQEITLDTKFQDSFTKNLNTLQESKNTLFEQRQFEEQQNKIKFTEMKILEEEWISKYRLANSSDWHQIYQECVNSEFEYYETEFLHDKFCKYDTLDYVLSGTYHYMPTGRSQMFTNIMNDIPIWDNLGSDSGDDKFSSYSKSCRANPHTDYLECMCANEINSHRWYDLCVGFDESPKISQLITEDSETNYQSYHESEPISVISLESIKSDYSECKKNEQYGAGCKDKLKNSMDEFCRMTTNSHTEYDVCFGEITEIQ
jgi:hypothetical protein